MNPEIPASATVRFDCPACGAVLTVPAAAAGLQGPCPKCWEEIVSPDPALGLPARLPALPQAQQSADAIPTAPPVPAEPAAAEIIPDTPPAQPETGSSAPAADTTVAAPQPPADPTPWEDQAQPIPAVTTRTGKAGWILALVSSSLVFAGIGYQLGKSQRPPEPNPPPHAIPAPATEPEPVALPEPEPKPSPEPPPPANPPQPSPADPTTPEAALREFLEAQNWKARGSRVLSPDEILPAMEKHAAQTGDGPIATTSVTLLEVAGPTHIFKVCTPTIPEGFPVAVSATDEGPMIDWESFTGFHDDHFRKFLEGPTGRSGIFDLLVKQEPEKEGDDAAHFVRFRLSVPMPDRDAVAWISKDSVALARLRAIFDGSGGFDKATVEKLAQTGIPVVLALEKKVTNDGRDFIEIKDFVAIGWAPPTP